MGNKNKYNNYFNGGQYQENEHSHNLETPENTVIEIENKDNEIIVESTDLNTVEITPVSDITPESIDISQRENPNSEEVVKNQETLENSSQNVETQNESTKNIQNVKVNAKALNIRREPKKDADIVTIVYENELLTLCESTSIDGFYKVKTSTEIYGYCMEKFVDLV